MEFIALVCCISAVLMGGRYMEHREEMARIEKGIEPTKSESGFTFQIGDDV